MSLVFLAIGSNIDPKKNLKRAAALLRERWPEIRFSSVYRTAPRDFEDQTEFLNAVARIETNATTEEILQALQGIERSLGKNIEIPKGPRTIDLDLLLYGDEIIPRRGVADPFSHAPATHLQQNLNLIIPHPRMHERRFVLEPLCEVIDPEMRHPVVGKAWEELLDATMDQECRKVVMEL